MATNPSAEPQILDRRSVGRRTFLKTSAAGGAALIIGFHLPAHASDPAQKQEKSPINPLNAWIRITPDNRVTLIMAKSEMGQGIMTALPMILAEELYLDWKQVNIEQAPTDPKTYDHGTGGSGSVLDSWLPLRQAGAAAREMLIAAAAKKWGVTTDTCRPQDGYVLHGHPERSFKYGELVADAALLPIPSFKDVPLKNSRDFTIVGHDTHRVDGALKATGTAKFGIDSRPDGLLYAVIARCPVFEGKVASFDATKAKAVPGVRDVFQIDFNGVGGNGKSTTGGVAVLADNSWAAIKGRDALGVKWDEGAAAKESSEELHAQFVANATAKPKQIIRSEGDANAALAAAPAGSKKIEAVYELPFAAHVCMEPMNCTVHIQPDRAEAWVPTQAPQWAQGVIAEAAKLPPEKVTVHTTLMGGGFGRRYQADFVMEAAQVAKKSGKPVMVVWTREDDMHHDFYRPASYHKCQGVVDAAGNLAAWKHFQTSTSIAAKWGDKNEQDDGKGEFGTGATVPYKSPNLSIEYSLAHSSAPRAWWRSVEHSSSGFVVESFVDELAAAASEDPVAFRLKLLGEPRKIPRFGEGPNAAPLDTARLKGVLQLAAEKAGWGTPLPEGEGRGIATFFSFETYTAAVAEVSLHPRDLKIKRLVCTVDCGRVVNPNGVRAQVESAAIYALTATLKDAITVARGRVVQSNFNDYRMLRMEEAPPIEVHLVASEERPTGIGEPTVPVIAPAVCNAIFNASRSRKTQLRIRRLPIRPDDLVQA